MVIGLIPFYVKRIHCFPNGVTTGKHSPAPNIILHIAKNYTIENKNTEV